MFSKTVLANLREPVKSVVAFVVEAVRSIASAIFIAGLCVLWFWLGWKASESRPIQQAPPDLPTIREVQKIVGAVPDGRLGPETQKRWERFLCDKYAKENWPK